MIVLSVQHSKMFSHFLLSSMIQTRNPQSFRSFLCEYCLLSVCSFQEFSFVWSFQKLNYDVAWISLVYPTWEFAQPLEAVDVHLSPNLWTFLLLFFRALFHSSLSYPSETPIIQILALLLLAHGSLRLSSFFFQFIFSLLFKLSKLYYSVLKLTNSILCHLHSTTEPLQLRFLFVIFLSSLISIWFFFKTTSISLLRL